MAGPTNTNNAIIQDTPLPVQQDSPLFAIPLDIVIEILKRMNPQDVMNCNLVCRKLKQIFSNDFVWIRLLDEHFPLYRANKEIENFQEIYKRECGFPNFADRLFACHPFQKYLAKMSSSFIVSDDNLICSRYRRSEIEVWNINTQKCVATLEGHTMLST